MQLEIRNAVERDGLTYNVLGILAGLHHRHHLLPARFRSWSLPRSRRSLRSCLRLASSVAANFNLNMFLNVMTPLIMVISFSDSMQLTFAARDRLIGGSGQFTAFRSTRVLVVGSCLRSHARHRRHIVYRAAIFGIPHLIANSVRRDSAPPSSRWIARALASAGIRRIVGA